MAKIKDSGNGMYSFYCLGCDLMHVYYVNSPAWKKDSQGWTFNGDFNKPSFTPSLLNRTGVHADPKWKGPDIEKEDYTKPPWSTICHLYVNSGMIRYLGDCTHELAGKTVEMNDIKPAE